MQSSTDSQFNEIHGKKEKEQNSGDFNVESLTTDNDEADKNSVEIPQSQCINKHDSCDKGLCYFFFTHLPNKSTYLINSTSLSHFGNCGI